DTQTVSGNFLLNEFIYADDLTGVPTPSAISYRIKMTIGADTSFHFDAASVNYQYACNTYTFTGNGNWTDASNWINNTIPPSILTAGSKIIIDPVNDGECILNVPQTVSPGAYFIVEEGKKLLVQGNLSIIQ